MEYYSFDPGARFCRELVRQLSANTLRGTNPKCEIATTVSSSPMAPKVDVTFGEAGLGGAGERRGGSFITPSRTGLALPPAPQPRMQRSLPPTPHPLLSLRCNTPS